MMLRLAFGLSEEADAVENAVRQTCVTVSDRRHHGRRPHPGGCAEMGRLVAERL